jgi:hypothetical protein
VAQSSKEIQESTKYLEWEKELKRFKLTIKEFSIVKQ